MKSTVIKRTSSNNTKYGRGPEIQLKMKMKIHTHPSYLLMVMTSTSIYYYSLWVVVSWWIPWEKHVTWSYPFVSRSSSSPSWLAWYKRRRPLHPHSSVLRQHLLYGSPQPTRRLRVGWPAWSRSQSHLRYHLWCWSRWYVLHLNWEFEEWKIGY